MVRCLGDYTVDETSPERWDVTRQRARRWSLVAFVVGLAVQSQPGTFASFGSSMSNAGTFATGTLVLSNQVESATACLSTGAGSTDVNANDACDALFDLATRKPGQATNVDVTLVNEGNLDASSLHLSWASPPCTTADAVGTSYHGGGDLCDVMRVQVQQYASPTQRSSNDRTGGVCWFGGGTATSCSYNNAFDLAALAAHDDGAPIDLGPMGPGEARYLRLYVQLPGTADNSVQGRAVTVPLRWSLAQ